MLQKSFGTIEQFNVNHAVSQTTNELIALFSGRGQFAELVIQRDSLDSRDVVDLVAQVN